MELAEFIEIAKKLRLLETGQYPSWCIWDCHGQRKFKYHGMQSEAAEGQQKVIALFRAESHVWHEYGYFFIGNTMDGYDNIRILRKEELFPKAKTVTEFHQIISRFNLLNLHQDSRDRSGRFEFNKFHFCDAVGNVRGKGDSKFAAIFDYAKRFSCRSIQHIITALIDALGEDMFMVRTFLQRDEVKIEEANFHVAKVTADYIENEFLKEQREQEQPQEFARVKFCQKNGFPCILLY